MTIKKLEFRSIEFDYTQDCDCSLGYFIESNNDLFAIKSSVKKNPAYYWIGMGILLVVIFVGLFFAMKMAGIKAGSFFWMVYLAVSGIFSIPFVARCNNITNNSKSLDYVLFDKKKKEFVFPRYESLSVHASKICGFKIVTPGVPIHPISYLIVELNSDVTIRMDKLCLASSGHGRIFLLEALHGLEHCLTPARPECH